MPCVSVVVPTFKRHELLTRCLNALLAQDFAPEDYEIIVADDADCVETKQLVEQRAKCASHDGYTIRYLAVKSAHGPAAARNAGCCAARGEFIAFTDDDCIPCSEWLKAGLAAFTGDVVAVTGRIEVPLPTSASLTDYEYNASHLAHNEFLTANCFYRRNALLSIGGFDERFTSAWREDSDLIFTLLEHGARCASAPQALVIHPVRPAGWGVSVRQQRKSMFNALLYKKHPVLYRQKIQAAPPWHYYAIVGASLLSMTGIVRCSRSLITAGLVPWAYLTGHFCLRRLRHTSHAPYHVAEMIVTSLVIPPLAIFWRVRGAIKFRVFFL